MNKALVLLLMAWTIFCPFATAKECAPTSCCAQMQSCCGHCHCTPHETCRAAQAPAPATQIATERLDLLPRVDVILFALEFHHPASEFKRASFAANSSLLDTSQVSRPRLCVWLI